MSGESRGRGARNLGETQLKALLRQRHWQTHSTFTREYDRAAAAIDSSLVGQAPAKAQFYRWLSGDIKSLPYPDHCRVLEAMLPGHTVEELFAQRGSDPVRQVEHRGGLRIVRDEPLAPVREHAPSIAESDPGSSAHEAIHGSASGPDRVDRDRMRALMSWVDTNSPIKERDIHAVRPDRRRSR